MRTPKNYWCGLTTVEYCICFVQTRQKVRTEASWHVWVRWGGPAHGVWTDTATEGKPKQKACDKFIPTKSLSNNSSTAVFSSLEGNHITIDLIELLLGSQCNHHLQKQVCCLSHRDKLLMTLCTVQLFLLVTRLKRSFPGCSLSLSFPLQH